MKKNLLLSIVVFALIGCGGDKQQTTEQQVPEKKVMKLEQKKCEVPLRTPAQLHGRQDIAIIPQVSATLEQVLVVEGQKVVKGQRMFILNQTAFLAAVDNAEANVARAQANVETQQLEVDAKKVLLDKDIISAHEYKVQENQLHMAKANLAEAKAMLKKAHNDLSYTVICAPHSGVVGTINHKQGALVSPQMSEPITIVSDNSVIYAYISISEVNYLSLINEYGSREQLLANLPDCRLMLNGNVEYPILGRVETMSGMIDPTTGAVSVRVAFQNPKGILAAGGSGEVLIYYEYDGIVIPRSATYSVQDKTFAFIVEQQADSSYIASAKQIEVYRLNESEYIVADGLKSGDLLVLEGVKKMTNGMPVVPIL